MTCTLNVAPPPALSASARHALNSAGQRIAPQWPLDRFIAVNPLWEQTGQNFEDVGARLATLVGARCLMPGAYYLSLWRAGIIKPSDLREASLECGNLLSASAAVAWCDREEIIPRFALPSELLDRERDLRRNAAWAEQVLHQLSQFCAWHFVHEAAPSEDAAQELYARWLQEVQVDTGTERLFGQRGLRARFAALPADHQSLLALAIQTFGLDDTQLEDVALAALLRINGWAAHIAWRRWQARLDGRSEDAMPGLLAMRLAWELVLWDSEGDVRLHYLWQQELGTLAKRQRAQQSEQRIGWIWQRAQELSYQHQIARQLESTPSAREEELPPASVQAVFCIDVRSEPLRRALEAQDDRIQTLGFAGFFGLPVSYQPAGSSLARPQLPGLLAPSLVARDGGNAEHRAPQFESLALARSLPRQGPTSFTFIESAGLLYLPQLLRESLQPGDDNHPINTLHQCEHTPLELCDANGPLSVSARATLCAGVLKAMSLVRDFAPLVLLVGHGSQSRNNPYAASLDCGACGGQHGDLNVRLLAGLLNDPAVREELAAGGIDIPAQTHFQPALHNTTTDDIHLIGKLPEALPPYIVQKLPEWLHGASDGARDERAGRLGQAEKSGKGLIAALRRRARDWSQVRPEWGLAGNAAFIAAPRARTRSLRLAGRAFLHEYRWQDDPSFTTLELILTAPVIVAHWINLQYYMSATDNQHFGSGNKLLHNVVGGHLGVFEGNGGDLRLGLPLQSLHDGERWQHPPLRLSVYIQAPEDAIADIVARHDSLRNLVDNGWLYLYAITDRGERPRRYYRGEWTAHRMRYTLTPSPVRPEVAAALAAVPLSLYEAELELARLTRLYGKEAHAEYALNGLKPRLSRVK